MVWKPKVRLLSWHAARICSRHDMNASADNGAHLEVRTDASLWRPGQDAADAYSIVPQLHADCGATSVSGDKRASPSWAAQSANTPTGCGPLQVARGVSTRQAG